MIVGINAGFGDSLTGDLPQIAALGYTGIRQDLQPLSGWTLEDRAAELRVPGIQPLYIVRGPQIGRFWRGETLELLNEPNLSFPGRPALTPWAYAQEWNTYAPEDLARGVVIYFGSISNLQRNPLRWLEQAWAYAHPKPTHVSYHRYPPESGRMMDPHKGFRCRDDELDALRQIVGGDTVLACTEWGYHQGPRKRWGFWPWRLNDQQQADAIRDEWLYLRSLKLARADIYQWNDGPDGTAINRFGVRRADGSLKPSATAH